MHCCYTYVSHFVSGYSFIVVVLGRFFYLGDKKVVAGCIRQVVVLYSNDCIGICLGELSIGRLRRVVVL